MTHSSRTIIDDYIEVISNFYKILSFQINYLNINKNSLSNKNPIYFEMYFDMINYYL